MGLADVLFTATQRRVLGLLFGQPERSFFANEIIDRVDGGTGAVQRELKKLVASGLVTVQEIGRQKHYQANPDCPVFRELCGLVRKTLGLLEPLREALEPQRAAIELALVYGSVARGDDSAASDIDLLVVSDTLMLEEVYRLLVGVEQALGRPVRPTLYTTSEFERRRRERSPFLTRVLEGDTLSLIGSIPDG